jgi:hypothetical protein
MRFEVLPSRVQRTFDIVYRDKDRALDSVPRSGASSYSSLSFNEVQLELDETGFAGYVWGYCPRESWRVSLLKSPTAQLGGLYVIAGAELLPGASIKISDTRLPVHYDPDGNWLCLGDNMRAAEFRVQIAPSLIVMGNADELIALWMQIKRFE